MLKIIVLGKGLIPRGLGLAPRKEPFKADLTLIQTILATPGLKVKMLHPEDGHLVDLTKSNLTSNWQKYSNYKKSGTDQAVLDGKKDKTPVETKVEEPKVDVKEEEKGQSIKPNVPVITKQNQEVEKKEESTTPTEEAKHEAPDPQNQNNNKQQGNNNQRPNNRK